MAKKPFLKLRRLYEDQGLLQKELSELSDIPLDTLKGRLNAPEDKGRWKACEIVKICKVLQHSAGSDRGVFLPGNRKGGKDRMKPYTLASERAAAPTGCAYIAPLFWNKWFRWGGSQASGCYQLGGQIKDESHTGLQIFADGEWHPVIGWALDDCRPAVNCLQEVGA